MNTENLFSSVPKLLALFGVLPFLLILLWLTWKVTARSLDVQTHWPRAEAQVVATGDDTVTLELVWRGEKMRREVKKEGCFKDLAQLQTLTLYMNPLNYAELRPATFGELWAGVITLGVFVLFLLGTGIFLMRVEEPKMPPGVSAEFAAAFAQAAANPQPAAARPHHEDDGRPIEMREPGETWKANVFWGLLFGLLLILPALFAPADAALWKRVAAIAAGLAWMIFMGRSAIQSHGRTVRCDGAFITVSQPSGTKRIALSEVKKVTRDDVREKLRKVEDVGRSRYRTKPLDTMAPIVLYRLRDEQGRELLKLDHNMEPASELRRFLDRMENLTGVPIRDE